MNSVSYGHPQQQQFSDFVMNDKNMHHGSYTTFYEDTYDNYYEFCKLLTKCLPCLEGEHHHHNCRFCPQVRSVVHSVDNLVYQNPELQSCLVLDRSSCLLYFAYSTRTSEVWLENGKTCPTLTRYDDNNNFLTDLVQFSPIFDVEMMCAGYELALMAVTSF